jgi:RNA polymerase sigma-70 factor (ECF subfamily)
VLLERALARLKQEFDSGERQGQFQAVADFFRPGEPPAYREVAARHGLTLPGLKSLLHRSRVRFRELLEQEAADTLTEVGEAATEVNDVLRILAA